jgi:hypothetical protein
MIFYKKYKTQKKIIIIIIYINSMIYNSIYLKKYHNNKMINKIK